MDGLDLGDITRSIFTWLHIIGGAVWVGGSILFAVVIRPVANRMEADAKRGILLRYRDLIGVAILLLLLSGAYLFFARVLTDTVGAVWIVLLVVKLTLVAWMVYIYWNQRRTKDLPSSPAWRRKLSALIGYDAQLALGVIVLLISSFLERVAAI